MNNTEAGKDAEADHEKPQSRVGVDSAAQALIGAQLKAMYAETCEEPVPPHLLDLVKKLEQAEGQSEHRRAR